MSKNLIDNKVIAIEVISKILAKYYVDAEKVNLDFVIQRIIARLA